MYSAFLHGYGIANFTSRRERKNIIDRAAWVGTRAKFMGQLTNFMAKIKFLNWLGAFTRDGQIKPRWVKFLKGEFIHMFVEIAITNYG